ncbi:hypothetical protein DXG03_003581 [Asterophora parasitica]|uniref:DUF6534 domain-containing protein n=1 Tax=Asterophora parasitica TaxID=117018 RepID=A0A9P7K899_9AGAR|nr:hypothetical protein DXG03_003581 [Asterophora parasitica]
MPLIASPLTLVYASFYFCIGRLYTNSFLATLNARKTLTGKADDVSHMLVSIPPTLLNTQHTMSKKSAQNISIRIDTTHDRNDGQLLDPFQISHRGHGKLELGDLESDDDLTLTSVGQTRRTHHDDHDNHNDIPPRQSITAKDGDELKYVV